MEFETQPVALYGASNAKRWRWSGRIWPSRIGRRLALGFGALVLLMLVALVQAGLQLRVVSSVTQKFATGDMQRLLRVQALSLQTEGVGSALIRLMNAPRQNRVAEYADVDERNRRIDGIIESLGNELNDPEQELTLKRLKACRAIYADAFITTVDQVEAGNMKAAAKALNEHINPALKAMLAESNTLLQRERQRIETQLEEAQHLFQRVAMWVIGLSLLVVAIAAWLAWRTTRSVVVPLVALETAARRIARGDYANPIELTGTQEVDRVGRALNAMTTTVAQREREIVTLAYQDALTGLPNRTALLDPAKNLPNVRNTVALIDLSRLKVINETLGYGTGDTLIRELGARVASVLDATSVSGLIGAAPVVARLSGGTFAAWFESPDRAVVDVVRSHIERAVASPVQCSGYSVDLSIQCGFADSGLESPVKPVALLLRNAEVALHTAKRGALGHAWHSEVQEAARLETLSLLSDLRSAVQSSQLQMWLQPKYSLVTGKAVGAEALVRWQHPTRGFVSPAEFIPFAEQTGYITMVTEWMLREALLTLKAWAPMHPELTIAVNISTRDLQDQGFVKRVTRMLASKGVEPRRLRLEITESGLMEDAQASLDRLHALHAVGTPLSIDDFGTGYSSMAYLQKMPVSELKIDRSFVDGIDGAPGTQKLVKAMIEMGHGMDLTVTAEGVETEAERDMLRTLGCDVMQGYLASRPLYGDLLQAWVDGLPRSI
jgi:predicted signal transduction protein with EAL and GGDEF domain